MFCGVGCHETIKGAELSYELDFSILFWSWILSGKYPHFMEISMFRGYYPYFMEISTFHGYYPHFVDISALRGYYLHLMEISTLRGYYLNFVDTIHILWIMSALATL